MWRQFTVLCIMFFIISRAMQKCAFSSGTPTILVIVTKYIFFFWMSVFTRISPGTRVSQEIAADRFPFFILLVNHYSNYCNYFF
uniref:Putative secreted protein n=1 Tax=Panstrongylus lignarius TaxID=156445 RepID=A0A224Y311_9HEMI